jgi:hypothetical protein
MVPDERTGGPRFAAFFERFVRHTKGRWSGQPFVLEPWQREFWWEALEVDPATGLRVYTEVGLGLPRKNGKALALDTPIPTPDGWSTMGELWPGDTVFDERGRPCRMMATSEVVLGRHCYRVSFGDGTSNSRMPEPDARRVGRGKGPASWARHPWKNCAPVIDRPHGEIGRL